MTAAFAYDGERGVLTNHRSTAAPQRPERNNTGTTVQYEASAERVSVVGGIRFENNGSFGFYAAPRVAASWLVNSGGEHDELGSTRLRASVGRGIKEPLFIQSYSPSPSFLGNPDLEAGAVARLRRRIRTAVRRRSRRDRSDVLREPLRRFDQPRPLRSGHVQRTVREHRRNARVRPRAGRHRHRQRRASRRRRLHVPRFEGHSQHQQQPDLCARTGAVPAAAPLGLAAGVLLAQPRQPWRSAPCSSARASTATSTFPASRRTKATPRGMRAARFASTRRTAAFVTIDNLADRDYMEPLGYPGLRPHRSSRHSNEVLMALAAEHISFAYGAASPPVLDDVSAAVARGGLVGILGPNGSGKTTLLRLLGGLLRPSGDASSLDGVDLHAIPRATVARRMAMVPQETQLAFEYTVLEMATMGRYPHLGAFEIEGPEDLEIAREALARNRHAASRVAVVQHALRRRKTARRHCRRACAESRHPAARRTDRLARSRVSARDPLDSPQAEPRA